MGGNCTKKSKADIVSPVVTKPPPLAMYPAPAPTPEEKGNEASGNLLEYVPKEVLFWNREETSKCLQTESSPCEGSSTLLAEPPSDSTSVEKVNISFINGLVVEVLISLFFLVKNPHEDEDEESESQEGGNDEDWAPSCTKTIGGLLRKNIIEKQRRQVQMENW